MKFHIFNFIISCFFLHQMGQGAELDTGRVRIGFQLTPYEVVTSQDKHGALVQRHLPKSPMKHTLRARLDRPNHFYVQDFHVQTTPLSWVSQTKRYKVRVDVSKRYGKGKVEEPVGSLVLTGTLRSAGKKGLWVLHGIRSTRLKDKMGAPLADLQVGHQTEEPQKAWANKGRVSPSL